MKIKYTIVYKKNLEIYIALVHSSVTRSNAMENIATMYSNTLNIDKNLIVLASENSLGNIEYVYGKEKIINLIKEDVNPNELVWTTCEK